MKKEDLYNNSLIFGDNAPFLEELYEKYLNDPTSVDQNWQDFFASEENVPTKKPSWVQKKNSIIGIQEPIDPKNIKKEKPIDNVSYKLNLNHIIEEYRQNGHYLAELDPLKLEKKNIEISSRLDPASFGITDKEFATKIDLTDHKFGSKLSGNVADLLNNLKQKYCNKIGYEFNHLSSTLQKKFLYDKVESLDPYSSFSKEEKKEFLFNLIEIDGFENFLHNRFPGAKRFSIEGSDSVVVAIEEVVKSSVTKGDIKEVIIGMPHRGRLNVLTKIMGKSYCSMLSEFQGNLAHMEDLNISGDVKYHLGRSSDLSYENGKKVHLSLTPNPSHLEAVNPVVAGKVRAKQDLYNDINRTQVMGFLLHGDAAFCGQGVVAETLSLSDLEGYKTGGTFHIVVNNQIGFTTSPHKQHTSRYPTEIAKIVEAPIIHVNGDDPEAVIFASLILEEFRKKFQKDVVLDVISYRRYGHNEGDEPMFTQPIMYKTIKSHKTPAEIYASKLIAENIINDQQIKDHKEKFHKFLEEEYEKSKTYKPTKADWLEGMWKGFTRGHQGDVNIGSKTGVDKELLKTYGTKLASIPQEFNINSKISKLFESKKQMMETEKDIDWATAEALAFASLLCENVPVRLSGQDSGRGTFSHRHSVLIDQNAENTYLPLNNISETQAKYTVIDSNLSEFAVLGFEYGFSIVDPKSLTIWEAQFGDFANGAQIIIDQFISSAEVKWQRMSGLVMLLPHGYEGQGPEHSSARLERFLQNAAECNMQIVSCTTPANFFHVLRRQIHRDFRKPLIVMSPKSLIRHKKVVSNLSEFDKDTKFITVIDEVEQIDDPKNIQRVVICSGKVYFDLLEERTKRAIKNIALIRLEQLYPFPKDSMDKVLEKYSNAKEVIWCQEEPKNMGAWKYVVHYIENVLIRVGNKNSRPIYVGRPNASSPAAGYAKIHAIEQAELINKALSNLT